jgi:hypothetical protein
MLSNQLFPLTRRDSGYGPFERRQPVAGDNRSGSDGMGRGNASAIIRFGDAGRSRLIRLESLELYCVCPGLVGSFHQWLGKLYTAVVVHAGLGDHEAGVAVSYLFVDNFHGRNPADSFVLLRGLCARRIGDHPK